MHRITAAFTVAVLTAAPTAAQQLTGEGQTAPQPTHARFEVLAGAIPVGCWGCGRALGFDIGATAWLIERVGISARVRGSAGKSDPKWLEPSVRLRGFVGDNANREIDFGIGRGIYRGADYYHHSYKVETLVGFRTNERVGFKVGGEVHVFHQRNKHPDGNRGLDASLLFTFLVVVRP